MESGLKYPIFNIKVKHEGRKALVFDEIRKKWIVLTPEEWVRQHLINYLVTEKKVPKSLISVEKEIDLNGTRKRYDLVIFNSIPEPILLTECKSPEIELTDSVAEQALRYNLILGVKYILLTNGLQEYIFQTINGKTTVIQELPEFSRMKGLI